MEIATAFVVEASTQRLAETIVPETIAVTGAYQDLLEKELVQRGEELRFVALLGNEDAAQAKGDDFDDEIPF